MDGAESLRQESNPHLGRTKGVCLPLNTTEAESGDEGWFRSLILDSLRAEWRRRESNPLLLGANEALCHQSFIPGKRRTGGVKPPKREATGLQPAELAVAQRPREGGRPGSNRRQRGSQPRMLPLTPQPPRGGPPRGRGRPDSNRRPGVTTGLEPAAAADNRALWPEHAPWKLRGWDSNPRSRAHEAREDSRSSTALRACALKTGLAGRSRTCDLRRPNPAGWPSPLQPDEAPPAGLEPAASGLRARVIATSTTGQG